MLMTYDYEYHARIQKVLSEGSILLRQLVIVVERRATPQTTKSGPVKRHINQKLTYYLCDFPGDPDEYC